MQRERERENTIEFYFFLCLLRSTFAAQITNFVYYIFTCRADRKMLLILAWRQPRIHCLRNPFKSRHLNYANKLIQNYVNFICDVTFFNSPVTHRRREREKSRSYFSDLCDFGFNLLGRRQNAHFALCWLLFFFLRESKEKKTIRNK